MLQYLGFDESKAHKIWENWNKLPLDLQLKDFVDFAMGFIYSADVWNNQDHEWTRRMEQMGINLQTVDAIMHLNYKEIRLTWSCDSWVRDTIRERHQVLLALQRTSEIRGERLQRYVKMLPGKDKRWGPKTSNHLHCQKVGRVSLCSFTCRSVAD